MPRLDLICAGEVFEDLIFHGLPKLPDAGEELKTNAFHRTIGGGAAITAVAGARLGLACGIVSALGGEAARRLRREGVRVRNLRRPGEPHALTVALSTARDRSFVTYNGVNDALGARLLASLDRVTARHVHFALEPRGCARWAALVRRLARRGVTTSWDFGWAPGLVRDPGFPRLLARLDFVFVNRAEALLYGGSRSLRTAIARWRGLARRTIVKLDREGSRWVERAIDVRASAPRVRLVDPTGAGDAFDAGFLAAVLRGLAPRDCLREGNRLGARAVTAAGGLEGLPRRTSAHLAGGRG